MRTTCPGTGLSARGLLGTSLQKLEGGQSVVLLSLSPSSVVEHCLRVLCRHGTLLERHMSCACAMGQSPSKRNGYTTRGHLDCLEFFAGMFLRIQSDIICIQLTF